MTCIHLNSVNSFVNFQFDFDIDVPHDTIIGVRVITRVGE